jgi:hypothetical protein
MNPMLKKLVDQEFMNEAFANYIEEALTNKDSFIVSGHKGWGILPLMATVSAVAKSNSKIKQVKGFEDLADEAEYYIIADLKDIDYAKLITDAMAVPNSSLIALKDPDHPYSFLKLVGDVFKANGDTSKTYQILECAKVNDQKKLSKITKITLNESGRPVKVDFKG